MEESVKGDVFPSASPSVETDPRVGATLAGYRVLSQLGRGGMGVVYLAEDPELSRQVALKVLSPELGEDESFRRRFAREWRLAASLEHPNVIPIHGAGEADSVLWIAMRYVRGTDLRKLLHDEGPLEPELAVAILAQVASALDAAHALGLVHRDVKPGNILLAGTASEGFHAYLADFGLTKRIVSSTSLTRTGAFVGTVAYAAPEQVENTPLDGRADQYALACVAYHCLAGQAPFADREDLGALWAHVFEPPPSLTSRRPGLPPGLDSALARGMAKSPDDRYPSCADMVRSLRAQVAGASQVGMGPTQEKARPSHDVFLSHHRADWEAAGRVAGALRSHGLSAFLPETGLDPERDWREQLEAALRDSAACVVLVGPGSMGEWDREDLRLARHLSAAGTLRLIPVLLPGLPDPFDPTALPAFLSSRAWVDLRTGLDDERTVRGLLRTVRGTSQAFRPPPAQVSSPYRGLQAFQEEDAPFFFGREGDVQRLVELLKATRFLTVVGPSGSGKSSLARAGLIPALRAGALAGSGGWHIRLIRPGAEPLVTLAAELLGLGSGPGMGATVDQLARDPRTLHLATSLALGDRETSERVAWVVDQFEEAFTLCHNDAEREAFVANLLQAASAPGGRDLVVLTVRADFYPRLAAHPALAPAVAAHQFVVPPLDAEGLRLAVEGPAELAGARFEEGLVDTILADTRAEPGALPLLEHALLELWERRSGSVLSLEGYRASGGVAGAIAARAEAVYTSFPPERQAVCRRVMLRLAQPGEGTEDTRRRARVGELATGPDDAPAVAEVLDSLVAARLVTASADEQAEPWVEVAHEALIRAWPRLRGWLEEDRAGLRLHRRLTEAAEEWARLGRDQSDLWRGARLLEATEWRARNEDALNPLEHEFLDASAAHADQEARETEERRQKELEDTRKIAAAQRRSARMFRLVALFLVLGLVGSGIATVFAIGARNSAHRALSAAETERKRALGQAAISRFRAAQEQAALALQTSPKAAAIKAVQAARIDPQARAPDLLSKTASLVNSLTRGAQIQLVPSFGISPDGHTAFAVGPDGSFSLWQIDGRLIAHVDGEKVRTTTAAFNRTGTLVATGTDSGTFSVTDASTGSLLKMADVPTAPHEETPSVVALAFTPDGNDLALGTTEGLGVIDWRKGKGDPFGPGAGLFTAGVGPGAGPVYGVEFAPPGALWTGLTIDRQGVEIGRLIGRRGGSEGSALCQSRETFFQTTQAYAASFGPVGDIAAVATSSGVTVCRISLTRVPTRPGHEQTQLTTHTVATVPVGDGPVIAFSWSHDGSRVVTAGIDGRAVVYDVSERQVLRTLTFRTGSILDAVFSGDGREVGLALSDGTWRVWDIEADRQVAVFRDPSGSMPLGVAFLPDGRVLTQDAAGTVFIWDEGRPDTPLTTLDPSS